MRRVKSGSLKDKVISENWRISRRRFLVWLSALTALPLGRTHLFAAPASAGGKRRPTAVILGPAIEGAAVLTVSHELGEGVSIRVNPGANVRVDTTERRRASSTLRHLQVRISGLSAGVEYKLEIQHRGKPVDTRKFRTLRASEKDRPIHVVLASCMDDFYTDVQKDMWGQVEGLGPDLLLLIGDNVYADRRGGEKLNDPGMDMIFQRYEETRMALDLFRQERLIPVFSTWDDHDLGRDNSHRETPNLAEVTDTFRLFFPALPMVNYARGPGVTSRLALGNFRFHIMDSRTFRVPKVQGEEDRPSGHWGAEQESWLFEGLKENGPLFHLIVNGDQFFGGYSPHFESFEADHPQALQGVLAKIKGSGARVMFLTGDRHFMELQAIEPSILGYPTFEMTSSAIHARVFPPMWPDLPNPRQIVGIANTYNFASLRFRREGSEWVTEVEGRGPGSKVLLKRELRVPSV